ncbi:MAG: hypothetical protein ACKO96_03435 [Flammeovirgaceae bacterium]
MKNQILSLFAAAVFAVASCNQSKHQSTAEETATESAQWQEMDSFHTIMAEAFHPYKDSSNLEPAKKSAEIMAAEAEKWAAASLPSKVDNEKVKQQLEKLKNDTRAFAEQVKAGAADADLGTALNSLHDNFHGIMESWNGGHKEHEHEHEYKH